MAGITEPLALPEWATNPPAAPPTTIVEPTSEEKAEGFQPTSVVQQVDITIEEVLDATEYSLLINDEIVEITSGTPGVDVDIRDALIAEAESISAITDVVFFTAISDTVFRISALEPGQAFSVTLGEDGQLSAVTTTANTTGKPVRQFFNWLFVTIYLWIRWFGFSLFRWSDLSGGWDVKSLGTLPTTGAGLDGTSGAAVSYINGHRVSGVVEAHTYPDEADVYVDLKDDGTWTYVVVANGAGAPAVTADSRRQWKVATDSVDRVSVTDLRTSFISIASTITWTFLGPLNAVNVDCNDLHVGGVLTADDTAELGGGANVASFLNVAGGGTFQNNVLCEADLQADGEIIGGYTLTVAEDITAGTEFLYGAPKAYKYVLPGIAGVVYTESRWSRRMTWATFYADLAKVSGSADYVVWPLKLQDGATIIGASWLGTNTVPGGQTVKGRIVRISIEDGSVEDILTTPEADWAHDASWNAHGFGAVDGTLDVVDAAGYTYLMAIEVSATATPTIARIEVSLTMPNVGQA